MPVVTTSQQILHYQSTVDQNGFMLCRPAGIGLALTLSLKCGSYSGHCSLRDALEIHIAATSPSDIRGILFPSYVSQILIQWFLARSTASLIVSSDSR